MNRDLASFAEAAHGHDADEAPEMPDDYLAGMTWRNDDDLIDQLATPGHSQNWYSLIDAAMAALLTMPKSGNEAIAKLQEAAKHNADMIAFKQWASECVTSEFEEGY